MLKHDSCWSGCFLLNDVCPNLPPPCSGICLNGGYASYCLPIIYIFSWWSLKPGHLPQRFFLFCKCRLCTAAKFSALTLKRDSLLKLTLSSFFTAMSQGGFSPYPHSVHFSGHGSAPPATLAVSVSDPSHVYVYLNRREALHSIGRAMGRGASLFILQWRAEIPGKELLRGQASLYQWPFLCGANLCLLQGEVGDPPTGMYGHALQCRMR